MELSVYCGALDSPARAASLADRLLDEARTRKHPLLYAYTLGGDVLSLGRFHVVPPARHGPVTVGRRKSGGRVAPLGDGYLALALALPHATLVAGEPHTVLPGQVLNRAVRGLLGALESLGRTLGPVWGNAVLQRIGEGAAYGAAAGLLLIAAGMAGRYNAPAREPAKD